MFLVLVEIEWYLEGYNSIYIEKNFLEGVLQINILTQIHLTCLQSKVQIPLTLIQLILPYKGVQVFT